MIPRRAVTWMLRPFPSSFLLSYSVHSEPIAAFMFLIFISCLFPSTTHIGLVVKCVTSAGLLALVARSRWNITESLEEGESILTAGWLAVEWLIWGKGTKWFTNQVVTTGAPFWAVPFDLWRCIELVFFSFFYGVTKWTRNLFSFVFLCVLSIPSSKDMQKFSRRVAERRNDILFTSNFWRIRFALGLWRPYNNTNGANTAKVAWRWNAASFGSPTKEKLERCAFIVLRKFVLNQLSL